MIFWKKLKVKFRKHDFDLENPQVVDSGILLFTKFICKNCGKSLCLDKWQMKKLPRAMAYGCNPYKQI